MNDSEKVLKQLKINRILLIVLIVLVFVFMSVTATVGVFAYETAKEYRPYIEQIKNIDYEKVNETIDKISEIDFEALSQIDYNGLSKSIESIDFARIGEMVESVDVDELTSAMESLKKAADMLNDVAENIAPILKIFN